MAVVPVTTAVAVRLVIIRVQTVEQPFELTVRKDSVKVPTAPAFTVTDWPLVEPLMDPFPEMLHP